MAGTVSISKKVRQNSYSGKRMEVVTVSWTADAADGSVPNTDVELQGFLLKAVTNPGSTAPTDNYDIELLDPEDATHDAAGGLLANRDTSNTEVAWGLAKNGTDVAPLPPYFHGTYTFKLSNNAVNSATGTCILYLVDSL